MIWLSEPTIERPFEISRAYNDCRRRGRVDRYRSRTEVTDDTILTAFLWMCMPHLVGEEMFYPANVTWKYMTKAVRRGISVEEAVTEAKATLANVVTQIYNKKILVFNTATAAPASAGIKQMLDEDEEIVELNVRTMLTSTPNHRINVYKYDDECGTLYIVLNNVDTPNVIYKLSAAIMYTENHFGDDTTKWAEAWMTGNSDIIYRHAAAYYKEYNDTAKERAFKEALETMVSNLNETKKKLFERRLNDLQGAIDSNYTEIARMMKEMNQIKANYLFQITMEEDQKLKDLQDYLKTCKDKVSYIKAENNALTLIYRTQLIYFEEDLLKPYFRSSRSNVVTQAAKWKQQLMKDLFINKKYTLQIESSIMLDLANKSFRYIPVTNLISTSQLQGIPNPHHNYYNCWGDNQPIIFKAIQDGDYLQAILTAFAAMSGLNLSDTAVIDRFIRDELGSFCTIPCLTDNETGETITISEYERRYRNASDETNE